MKNSKIIGTLVNYTLVKILVNWLLDTFTYFCNVFIQLICFLIGDLAKIGEGFGKTQIILKENEI